MKLLVLGGTRFAGRFFAETAIAKGHEVTVVHRGEQLKTFPGATNLIADRSESIEALDGGTWDAAVDFSALTANTVRATCARLVSTVDTYALASTITVYEDFPAAGVSETSPTVAALFSGEPTPANYGALKVGAEETVLDWFGERALIARLGCMVGPRDYSQRISYWLAKTAIAAPFVAPKPPRQRLQVIDGRDVALWLLHACESATHGVFNVTGQCRFRFDDFLNECQRSTGGRGEPVWVEPDLLKSAGLTHWFDLPLCLDLEDPPLAGFFCVDTTAAQLAGLVCRPWQETVRDTNDWRVRQEEPEPPTNSLAERRVLELSTRSPDPTSSGRSLPTSESGGHGG